MYRKQCRQWIQIISRIFPATKSSASGERGRQTVYDGMRRISLPERAVCRSRGVQMPGMQGVVRGLVVQMPVVPVWYERPWC